MEWGGEREWKVGSEIDRLLPTFMGSVFQRRSIENPLLFLAIWGRKRGGFTPVIAFLRELPKIFFIPFEPSPCLPFGVCAPYSPATRYFALTFFLRTCLILNVNY